MKKKITKNLIVTFITIIFLISISIIWYQTNGSIFGWMTVKNNLKADGLNASVIGLDDEFDFGYMVEEGEATGEVGSGNTTQQYNLYPGKAIKLKYTKGLQPQKYTINIEATIEMPINYTKYKDYTTNNTDYYYVNEMGEKISRYTGSVNFNNYVTEALKVIDNNSAIKVYIQTTQDLDLTQTPALFDYNQETNKYNLSSFITLDNSQNEIYIFIYFDSEFYITKDGILLENSNPFIGQIIHTKVEIYTIGDSL